MYSLGTGIILILRLLFGGPSSGFPLTIFTALLMFIVDPSDAMSSIQVFLRLLFLSSE